MTRDVLIREEEEDNAALDFVGMRGCGLPVAQRDGRPSLAFALDREAPRVTIRGHVTAWDHRDRALDVGPRLHLDDEETAPALA